MPLNGVRNQATWYTDTKVQLQCAGKGAHFRLIGVQCGSTRRKYVFLLELADLTFARIGIEPQSVQGLWVRSYFTTKGENKIILLNGMGVLNCEELLGVSEMCDYTGDVRPQA